MPACHEKLNQIYSLFRSVRLPVVVTLASLIFVLLWAFGVIQKGARLMFAWFSLSKARFFNSQTRLYLLRKANNDELRGPEHGKADHDNDKSLFYVLRSHR